MYLVSEFFLITQQFEYKLHTIYTEVSRGDYIYMCKVYDYAFAVYKM